MRIFIYDFVSSKEPEHIGIIHESFHDGENTLQEILGIRRGRLFAVEMLTIDGCADVQQEVDPGGIVDRDTLVVVQLRVKIVDTDGVNLKIEREAS